MPRLIQNVVKNEWVFSLHFSDGRNEKVTVNASCFSAAVLSLPRFSDVGKYRYTLLKNGGG